MSDMSSVIQTFSRCINTICVGSTQFLAFAFVGDMGKSKRQKTMHVLTEAHQEDIFADVLPARWHYAIHWNGVRKVNWEWRAFNGQKKFCKMVQQSGIEFRWQEFNGTPTPINGKHVFRRWVEKKQDEVME